MLQKQLPIINAYTHSTRDVAQFSNWDYKHIEQFLDKMIEIMEKEHLAPMSRRSLTVFQLDSYLDLSKIIKEKRDGIRPP